MSIFVFVKDHIVNLPAILGLSSNGTYASANESMMKVLR